MRILVVEDDPKLLSFVVGGLREVGYAADGAADGKAGLEMALAAPYDAAVVDVMLPGLDGLSLVRELRRSGSTTPVLILSARRSVEERVKGLDEGGDDYLTKPFSFEELLARLRALARRTAPDKGAPARLAVADLELDPVSRRVVRAGRVVELQAREFALLECLLRNAGRPVTRTMILEKVFDYRFDPETNVVDVLVHRLRDKVDAGHAVKLIHTVRGVGYAVRLP
jgi:two-component system OmpR family response regulator